jgi:prepilin-type N-terminal cleavage/methylation domain-containing protein
MRKLVRTVRNAFRYGEAGFTLIELLVVIGILAALAGVVTLGVTQFIGRGCTEAASTEQHNIQTAVAGCMIDLTIAECSDMGDLQTDGYLLTAPHGHYTVDADTGEVTQTDYLPCHPVATP